MSVIIAMALLVAADGPAAVTSADPRYKEAAATVRGWVAKLDLKAKGDPSQLLICDWQPGNRVALVKIMRAGTLEDYPSQAIYIDKGGSPTRIGYSPAGEANSMLDQPALDAALKLCAPQMAK